MKITAQEEYGVRCLLRLARAGQALTIPEIAATENLSIAYVGKLLMLLRQAGLVESVRGRSGGYHLVRNPGEITLAEALLALGEPLFDDPGYCTKHAGPETTGPCVHTEGCHLRGLWQTLANFMQHILEQVTLQDLLTGELPIVHRLREQMPTRQPLLSLSRP
jgi:Rrf2 family protein